MSDYYTYATLEDFKGIGPMELTDITDDTRLRLVLEAASAQIDDHCNRHFYVETATLYYDGHAGIGRVVDQYTQRIAEYYNKLWVDDLLSISALAMDSDGDATYEDVLATTDYILWPWNEWPKVRIDLDLRQGDYAYWVAGQKRIEIAGQWGYGNGKSATPYTSSGATVTVADATTTTFTTSDGGAFRVCETILAGTEQAYITAKAGEDLTVVRGVNGTTAAAHSAATAYIYAYPSKVRWATLLQAQRLWARKDAIFGVMGTTSLGEVTMRLPPLDPDIKLLLEKLTKARGYRGAV